MFWEIVYFTGLFRLISASAKGTETEIRSSLRHLITPGAWHLPLQRPPFLPRLSQQSAGNVAVTTCHGSDGEGGGVLCPPARPCQLTLSDVISRPPRIDLCARGFGCPSPPTLAGRGRLQVDAPAPRAVPSPPTPRQQQWDAGAVIASEIGGAGILRSEVRSGQAAAWLTWRPFTCSRWRRQPVSTDIVPVDPRHAENQYQRPKASYLLPKLYNVHTYMALGRRCVFHVFFMFTFCSVLIITWRHFLF